MNIPLDEVIYFDCITSTPSTGAAVDADSTPTFAVYEEATDTDIGVGGNLTKRTSLTGNYRGSFTLSAANGFEVGKWYNVIGSAVVGGVTGKAVLKNFRVVAAEAIAGKVKADVDALLGTAWLTPGTAGTPDVNVKLISDDATAANNAESFFDGTGYAGTNNVIPTVTTLTGHTAQTGDSFARLTGTGAVTFASLTVTGSTSLAALSTSGTVTLNALTVTNATTLTGIVSASNASNTILLGTNMITSSTIATDAIGSGELAASAITEIQSGLATSAALTSAQSDITAILADTNELQTDWANGGRLDLILDARASQTSVDDVPTNAELATALAAADDAVLAAIAALNNLSAADVNAQVLDCLATDTYAEPGQGTPAATTTLAVKINYLYKLMRNKFTQTSTTQNFYADDASTVDHKATVSDDGSTFTRGEIASGP